MYYQTTYTECKSGKRKQGKIMTSKAEAEKELKELTFKTSKGEKVYKNVRLLSGMKLTNSA